MAITWDPTQPVATRPLAIQKDGTWYCYGWDLTKNICEVFGQNGYIRTAYSYTPYGNVTANGDITQPIQWSSEYADTDLALVYYNYRHYNPMDGRWLGRDPIGEVDEFNLFIYIQSQPISYIDLLGRNNMTFWSPTACMPISKPTRSLLPSGIGKTDFIPKKGNDVLVFDGEKICIMKYDFSICKVCWEATSGKYPENPDNFTKETQKIPKIGPIPEGIYIVPWTNIEYPDNPEGIWSLKGWNKYAIPNIIVEKAAYDFKISYRENRIKSAWGNYAVRLHPTNGTNTYNRTNFNIHGGNTKGSSGCIDIGRNDISFFKKIREYADALFLYVDYSGKKTEKCDSCPCYYKNAWHE